MAGDKLWIAALLLLFLIRVTAKTDYDHETPIKFNVSLWPTNIIPYQIFSDTDNPQTERFVRRLITAAVKEFSDRTCIRFVEKDYSNSTDIVNIVISRTNSGCLGAFIGHQQEMTLSLGLGCPYRMVLRYMMRVLGFVGEHLRIDRDKYLEVLWQNVNEADKHGFSKYIVNYTTNNNDGGENIYDKLLQMPYDYLSVTHAYLAESSKNHRNTMRPKYSAGKKMGLFSRLSDGDLAKLNLLYNCTNYISSETAYDIGTPVQERYNDTEHRIVRTWPNGIIPYVIEAGYEKNPHFFVEHLRITEEVIRNFSRQGCVQFKAWNNSEIFGDYVVIVFVGSEPCLDPWGNGNIGGPQLFRIGSECAYVTDLLQLLVRYSGLEIDYDLMRPDRERHFKISDPEWFPEMTVEVRYINDNGEFVNYDALNETVDWDYLSSFFLSHTAADGHVTLKPRDRNKYRLPTTLRLAVNDSCWYFSRGIAEKLGHLYNCLPTGQKRSEAHSDDISAMNISLWTSHIIPYQIIARAKNPASRALVELQISAAFNEFHNRTCIRFIQSNGTNTSGLLQIVIGNAGTGCGTSFRRTPVTEIFLLASCAKLRTVLGLLMRILGFTDEFQRIDRDKYVEVKWENVQPEDKVKLQRLEVNYNEGNTELYDRLMQLPYDYLSVVHDVYDNGRVRDLAVLLPRYENGKMMNKFDRLSHGDLRKINLLYKCTTPVGMKSVQELGRPINGVSSIQNFYTYRLWPNGEIPYIVADGYENDASFSQFSAAIFNKAFRIFNEQSCLQLVPRTKNERDYLVLYFADDCIESFYGRVGGAQRLTTGSRCNDVGVMLRELLNIAGITTDLQRIDRDEYFQVPKDLINYPYPSYGVKFMPYYMDANERLIAYDPLNESIDYNFLSNFYQMENRSDGLIILTAKPQRDVVYPETLSLSNLAKIQHLYNCTGKKTSTVNPVDPFPPVPDPRNLIILLIMAGVAVFVASLAVVVMCLINRIRNRLRARKINRTIFGYKSKNIDTFRLFEAKMIEMGEVIGKGNFGVVYKGTIQPEQLEVAVKLVKTNHFLDAVQEAKMHYDLHHENIVGIHGLSFDENKTLIILELMDLGNLKEFLELSKPSQPGYTPFKGTRLLLFQNLLDIARQIACGLEFMTSKGIVHRDLSARNCLVASQDSASCPYLVKVSDFGLSRRLYKTSYYPINAKKEMPVIVAPECLKTLTFTHQSDIWSFGITIWEIFSFGRHPFAALPNELVQQRIMSGIIPQQPESYLIYDFLKQCLHIDSKQRPTAIEAEQFFQLQLDS